MYDYIFFLGILRSVFLERKYTFSPTRQLLSLKIISQKMPFPTAPTKAFFSPKNTLNV